MVAVGMFGKCYRPEEFLAGRPDLRTVVFSCFKYHSDGSQTYCHDCECDHEWNMSISNCVP